jgi:heparanase
MSIVSLGRRIHNSSLNVVSVDEGRVMKHSNLSRRLRFAHWRTVIYVTVSLNTPLVFQAQSPVAPFPLRAGTMRKLATVDERFQSYNIEAVEVTGGRFWKPYGTTGQSNPSSAKDSAAQAGGVPADLFQYRPPIDLTNKRLRLLGRALGPAYLRVSGTWRNATYFHDADTPAPKDPPPGFSNVLTKQEWKGVVDYAASTGSKIITSVATSGGTRDKDGTWTSDQAEHLFRFTRSIGGSIAATEFMNEPTLAKRGGGVPDGYGPEAYGRDVKLFRSWLQHASPETLFLGPGGEGEGMGWHQPATMQRIPSEELLRFTASDYDVYSYHFYSAISSRCSGIIGGGIAESEALSPQWFAIPERVNDFYTDLRDRYMAGKPVWVTETGEAACGGDRWASTYLDAFRYLNELGALARHGVKVVAHNTLAASDYALLDEDTVRPRPNYWAALLWRRFMGTTVLDAGPTPSKDIYLFAQCLRKSRGGVALLAINAGTQDIVFDLGSPADMYELSAPELDSKTVRLNGHPLSLTVSDQIPSLKGKQTTEQVTIAPHVIAFLLLRHVENQACLADTTAKTNR